MAQEPKPTISIVSNNQSGGITAQNVYLGRQPFELADDLLKGIVAKTPHDKPVEVVSAGNSRAHKMGEMIAEALTAAGHQISRIRKVTTWGPTPDEPLTLQERPDFNRIVVAPDT